MNKKLLFVTAHFPSYRAKYAGHKTAFKILKEYSNTFINIDLIIICNKEEIDLDSLSKLTNVSIKLLIPLTTVKKLTNILKSRKLLPLKVMSRFSSEIINYIKKNINSYDRLHFEFTHAAFPLIFMPRKTLQNKTISISCHDILLQSNLRKKTSLLNSMDTTATYKYEETIFSITNQIIVLNKKDKNILTSLYSVPENKIKLVSPYVSEFVYRAEQLRKQTKQDKILLFWGAMNREENVEAVIEFIKRYKNLLKEKGYKLCIVGANPPTKISNLSKENNIIVTGFVEDPTEYFAKAKYGIVPLLKGAGIKVKTLEMLKAGLRVISTPVGAEGIEHKNLIVSDLENWKHILDDLLS